MSQIIEPKKIFQITDVDGYPHDISRLLCMMNVTRFVTLQSVKGLNVKELDFLLDDKSNSIGALLFHFAAVELFYQAETFEEREFTEIEIKKWQGGMDLGEAGRNEIKGNDLKFYTDILNETRNRTHEIFREKNDEWLYEKSSWGKVEENNFYKWFHVFEDEINHRGQINLIKRIQKIIK
ncbi:MAG: DUF664 domain-containing protein [bacterium]